MRLFAAEKRDVVEEEKGLEKGSRVNPSQQCGIWRQLALAQLRRSDDHPARAGQIPPVGSLWSHRARVRAVTRGQCSV